MTSDWLEGTAREIAGRTHCSFAMMVGDDGTHAEGVVRQAGGKAQNVHGQAKQAVDSAGDPAGDLYDAAGGFAQRGSQGIADAVRDYPCAALLLAAGLGYVAALLMRRLG